MIRFLVLSATLFWSPLNAQEDSVMRQAVQLATEGQSEAAQTMVRAVLAAADPQAPGYAEALYTAGVIATDVDSAQAYFRRVSIDYSNSAWADEALLRLSNLAFATGDLAAAIGSAERILSDYPSSDARAAAAFVAAQVHLEQRNDVDGCRYIEVAHREAGENTELRNRAAFHRQRCTRTTGSSTSNPPPGGPAYTVQVAALGTSMAADAIIRSLSREGHETTVVREDGLFKVRVGRFESLEDAQALVRQLRRQTAPQAFVVREP